MAPRMASFPDNPRILSNDSHDQREKFQGKSKYLPVSRRVPDTLFSRGVRVQSMASRMDSFPDSPDLLYVRE